MFQFSFASIAHDNINASSDTVGELACSFAVYSLCGWPSALPYALIVPSCLSFKKHMVF